MGMKSLKRQKPSRPPVLRQDVADGGEHGDLWMSRVSKVDPRTKDTEPQKPSRAKGRELGVRVKRSKKGAQEGISIFHQCPNPVRPKLLGQMPSFSGCDAQGRVHA